MSSFPARNVSQLRLQGSKLMAALAAASIVTTTLVLTSFGAGSAQAAVMGGFNIDGIVLGTGGEETDAVFFADPSGSVKELGPANENTTKLGNIHEDAVPTLGYTDLNPGNDLSGVWLDTNVDANGDVWLYFAFVRDDASTGQVGFEFQQAEPPLLGGLPFDFGQLQVVEPTTPNAYTQNVIDNYNPWVNRAGDGTRGNSDFLIVFDVQGQSDVVGIRYFDQNQTQGQTNGVWTDTEIIAGTYAEAAIEAGNLRGEGAINLSKTVFPTDPPRCFSVGNVLPYTVTGNSDTADLKDVVITDFASGITISNCGEVRVQKVTIPAGATDDFTIDLSQADNGVINSQLETTLDGTLAGDGGVVSFPDLFADTDYQLTETNLPAGWVIDNIEVAGQNPDYDPASDTFSVTAGETTVVTITNLLPPVPVPGYEITKTVTDVGGDGPDGSADEAGDVIDYQITITNTGTQGLTNVSVSDPLLATLTGPTGDVDSDGVLDADESILGIDSDGDQVINAAETWSYTGSYAVTQADIDGNGIDLNGATDGDGDVDNTASVISTELPDPLSASAVVPVVLAPAITIVKSGVFNDVDADGFGAAGETITYGYQVTNTGNVTLHDVTVTDAFAAPAADALLSDIVCVADDNDHVIAVMAPAAVVECSATYTLQQADVDNGGVINTATASGLDPSGEPVADTDDESVPLALDADLSIIKTASVLQVGAAGGFDWILDVTNNGPATAVNVVVTDVVPSQVTVTGVTSSDFTCGNSGNTVTCTVASMAVGATGRVTIAVSVPSDTTGATIENVGSVESDTPESDLTNNSDDASVDFVSQSPATTSTTTAPVTTLSAAVPVTTLSAAVPVTELPKTGAGLDHGLSLTALLLTALGAGSMLIARRRRTGPTTA